jgi:cytoskeletal protein CcmA (bactofilin family)
MTELVDEETTPAERRLAALGPTERFLDLMDLPLGDRRIRGELVRTALQARHDLEGADLYIAGAVAVGLIDLSWMTLRHPLTFGDCTFPDGFCINDAAVAYLAFIRCEAPLLDVSRADLSRGLDLEESTVGLRGHDLRSQGSISFLRTQLSELPEGGALTLRGASIKGALVFRGGCTFDDRAILKDVHVEGSIIVEDLEAADARLELNSADIGGDLSILSSRIERIELMDARVGGRVFVRETALGSGPQAQTFVGDGAAIRRDLAFHAVVITGQLRLPGASVGGQLNLVTSRVETVEQRAVTATNLTVGEGVVLEATAIEGELRMDRSTLGSSFSTPGSTFDNPEGDAIVLDDSTINGSVHLVGGVRVHGAVVILGAQVNGQVSLRGAELHGRPDRTALIMDGSSVRGSFLASDGLVVDGDVKMRGVALGFGHETGATLSTSAIEFDGAEISGRLEMGRSRFGGSMSLAGAAIGGIARFDQCVFRSALSFRATHFANGTLILSSSTFDGPATIHINDADLTVRLKLARVARPLRFVLNVEHTVLDGASFEAETTIEATGTLTAQQVRVRASSRIRSPIGAATPLKLTSLSDASFDSTLTIGSDVDLSACQFTGAQNLDRVVLSSTTSFDAAPSGRRALFEEHSWRADRRASSHWPIGRRWPAFEHRADDVDARQLALLYRGLRKGLEDAKNAPGASDFYYGEMEMRRKTTRKRAEGTLLFAYWATSGYGLRASRALVTLAIALTVATAVLVIAGFDATTERTASTTTTFDPATGQPEETTVSTTEVTGKEPSVFESALYASHAGLALTLPENIRLTPVGALTRALLRVALPILLGLLFVCVRSQVHR